ncbi:uncharacterized protein EDB93DRAFT_1249004 [Suillus bovinus]|uniref:uncharacterized protein n=1 Tax=Suillus bovinus TaxID=48563 RepID=UPI001B86DB2B|nr:uncharacterized protein EDB93DRAFT_1249004 [Suillus bovinus]KAG2153090.1 hypothetical protein EDB93DRAFT_1249004 [Suillus bovinus]
MRQVIKYEVDEATPNTFSYLGTFILGIKTLNHAIKAINTTRGGVINMVKAKEEQHAVIAEAGGVKNMQLILPLSPFQLGKDEVHDRKQREKDEIRKKIEEELWEMEEQKKKMLKEREQKLEEENEKLSKLMEGEIEKDSEEVEAEAEVAKAEMAEVEEAEAEAEAEEVLQKGKKRGKSGGSERPSKKTATDNICGSSRARQPSKKAIYK